MKDELILKKLMVILLHKIIRLARFRHKLNLFKKISMKFVDWMSGIIIFKVRLETMFSWSSSKIRYSDHLIQFWKIPNKMTQLINFETTKLISVIPISNTKYNFDLKCARSCENTSNSSDLLVYYTIVSFVSQDIC